MNLYHEDDNTTIWRGDCLDVLAEMPDNSVDAIVTDPPYGLGFMGKAWDDLPPGLPWAQECLRVLKPGGHLLAFGGTRTWHRLAVAVEDAGFEVRDSIAWLYGSGFPKSLDVSKAIDKAARGDMVRAKLLHFIAERGVDGKWLVAQGVADAKSLHDWTEGGHVPSDRNWQIVKDALGVTPEEEAAYEREITRHATEALRPGDVISFDQRSSTTRERRDIPATAAAQQWQGWGTALKPAFEPIVVARKPLAGTVAANVLAHGTGALNIDGTKVGGAGGRWPANVLLDGDAAAELDEQSGERPGMRSSRFFPTFRYQAKAPTRERPTYVKEDGTKVAHPTVKPLALIRWLVRLVTPPGGTVLDMFAGSGTTGEACILEGFSCILIEREADYLPLIGRRLSRYRERPA